MYWMNERELMETALGFLKKNDVMARHRRPQVRFGWWWFGPAVTLKWWWREWISHSSGAGVFKQLSVTAGLRTVHQPKLSSQQRPVTTDEGLEDPHKLCSSR